MTEKLQKFLNSQLDRVKGFEEIGLPEDGEQIMLVSDESFNALTFLIYMINENEIIDELILSYYSFNVKAMEFIDIMIESGVIKKFIFQTSTLTKYGPNIKIPYALSEMIEKYGEDKIQGSLISSHAKVMICRTRGKYYVIEGSANMSKKQKTEQYLIEQSKDSYNFHKEWISSHEKREELRKRNK